MTGVLGASVGEALPLKRFNRFNRTYTVHNPLVNAIMRLATLAATAALSTPRNYTSYALADNARFARASWDCGA